MERKIYIGSAWPYANGSLHLGHVAGLLPADLLARYHRLCGDEVLWTSGSDCHGTPITERARQEGKSPREIAEFYHSEFTDSFARLGFSYSRYGRTMEEQHHRRVQESFLDLYGKGLIFEDDDRRALCEKCGDRADREITGTCPHCGSRGARGDQCTASECGQELNPTELIDPKCAKCFEAISFNVSRELFFDLPALEARLREWVGQQTHWRENAKKWTEGMLAGGLKPRVISRKLPWGIPIPLPGWKEHCIYVWFEAVHGYLTASMEWAEQSGNPDAWKPFWKEGDPNVLHYYVIGKDNIPFHTLMWPGILFGRGGLALPWHIVSSEFLGLEGRPLSTSRNWAIWVPDFLSRHEADALRYYLIANGPEKKDIDFTWAGFVQRWNSEVVDNWGNLAHRLLTFARARFGGIVPTAEPLDDSDIELVRRAETVFREVGTQIEATEFREALRLTMTLVQDANTYLNRREPWHEIKQNFGRAATTVNTALRIVAGLAVLTEPFMPAQAQRLQKMLGTEHKEWSLPALPGGTKLGEIEPLFVKLDEKVAEEELLRLKAQSSAAE